MGKSVFEKANEREIERLKGEIESLNIESASSPSKRKDRIKQLVKDLRKEIVERQTVSSQSNRSR